MFKSSVTLQLGYRVHPLSPLLSDISKLAELRLFHAGGSTQRIRELVFDVPCLLDQPAQRPFRIGVSVQRRIP